MKKSYIKEDVLTYLDDLCRKTNDTRLVDQKIRTNIIELVENACKITNLPVSDLLLRLDFKPKDLRIEALEAFLAELRSIFWLRDFGFTAIQPLQAKKKLICPDFTATYKDKTCAIETFCLTQTHEQQKDTSLEVYRNFDPQFTGSKFGRDSMSKANNKKKQLDSSDAKIKILLCVINSQPVIRLNTGEEMQNHAKFLYDQLGWGNSYYLGLLTGVCSDTIYPKIY